MVLTDLPFTEEMKIIVFVVLLSANCKLIIALKRKHFYLNDAKSWSDAQSYCREHYDDLSSVDSLDEIAGLIMALNTYPFSWIGLQKISANNWQWSDGSSQRFFNWEIGQPNNPLNAFCSLIFNGKLFDNYCSVPYPFFCYKWEPELIVIREKKCWEDALQYCRTRHTDLASLPSFLHLTQVNKIIAMIDSPSVWTGLRSLSGSWFWVSGEALGDKVLLPSCPADHSYCGSRNLKTRSWENRECMEKLYFVCY